MKSRHDDGPISSKPLLEFNPEDLIGRTFLLPPGDNGERLRAKVTRKVVEDIEKADGERVQKLSYILGIGNGKVEELISYNQLVDHLEAAANEDNEINDDLFKFSALIGHQGPLKPTDPNWKGCKFNVLVEWETGEKTYEPLSILAADDPVTCATYAKENDLLHIEGWKRFRTLTKGTLTTHTRPQSPTIYILIHITLIYYTYYTNMSHLPQEGSNRSLSTPGGLMADVPCLDRSLDGC